MKILSFVIMVYHVDWFAYVEPCLCGKKFCQMSQHPFMIKTHHIEYSRNISQHNKGHLQQAHRQHNTQRWKAESLSEIQKQDKDAHSPFLFNMVLEVPATAVRKEKEVNYPK